jgi:ribonucleotide reductase alpha subunit
MGTDLVRTYGNSSLNNCYACTTTDLIKAVSWATNCLFHGGGVGFDCAWGKRGSQEIVQTPEGTDLIRRPDKTQTFTFCIPDSRQGWGAALELLIRAYIPVKGVLTNAFPQFDYSLIRPYGAPIKTFGGTAPGPEPLRILLARVEIFLDTFLDYAHATDRVQQADIYERLVRRQDAAQVYSFMEYDLEATVAKVRASVMTYHKPYDSTRLIVDLFNSIGGCVVSGNVRRSSLIALADAGDRTLLDLKNLEINPERASIYYLSNNTVRFWDNQDFDTYLPEIVERIKNNGEPGFANMINAQRYGRYTNTEYGPDKATLLNPCLTGSTQIKTSTGWRSILELVDCQFEADVNGIHHPSNAEGFQPTGEQPIYCLSASNGRSIEATPNHRFSIYRGSQYEWTEMREIQVGDLIQTCDTAATVIVTSIVYKGVAPVYDCTIPGIQSLNANGFLSHNCGEILLETFEPCTLSTICPYNCRTDMSNPKAPIDEKAMLEAAHHATFYATVVTTIRHHWPESNEIIARNRRIGVSYTGVANVYESYGCRYLIHTARMLYAYIRATNTHLTSRLGIPRSVRVTTIKPEGTLSIIMGVGAGVHFPICRFGKRRVGFDATNPIINLLREAGYEIEPSVYNQTTTNVIFPISSMGARAAKAVSLREKFELAAIMQRHFSDNSVSFTGDFSTERELDDVERVLAAYANRIKAASLLPYSDGEDPYPQMPFEEIAEAEYLDRAARTTKVDWSSLFAATDAQDVSRDDVSYCTGDACERPASSSS